MTYEELAPVVEAVDIGKRFGSTVALDRAGITVRTGETHALVGRNGAGKSTLVDILTGLQAPDTGRVTFGGRAAPPLGDRDAWRRQVACVYQKSTIIGALTVAENLFLNRHDRGAGGLIRWRALRRSARELLATWSVDVDVDQPASALTVEQRQFVEIAFKCRAKSGFTLHFRQRQRSPQLVNGVVRRARREMFLRDRKFALVPQFADPPHRRAQQLVENIGQFDALQMRADHKIGGFFFTARNQQIKQCRVRPGKILAPRHRTFNRLVAVADLLPEPLLALKPRDFLGAKPSMLAACPLGR